MARITEARFMAVSSVVAVRGRPPSSTVARVPVAGGPRLRITCRLVPAAMRGSPPDRRSWTPAGVGRRHGQRAFGAPFRRHQPHGALSRRPEGDPPEADPGIVERPARILVGLSGRRRGEASPAAAGQVRHLDRVRMVAGRPRSRRERHAIRAMSEAGRVTVPLRVGQGAKPAGRLVRHHLPRPGICLPGPRRRTRPGRRAPRRCRRPGRRRSSPAGCPSNPTTTKSHVRSRTMAPRRSGVKANVSRPYTISARAALTALDMVDEPGGRRSGGGPSGRGSRSLLVEPDDVGHARAVAGRPEEPEHQATRAPRSAPEPRWPRPIRNPWNRAAFRGSAMRRTIPASAGRTTSVPVVGSTYATAALRAHGERSDVGTGQLLGGAVERRLDQVAAGRLRDEPRAPRPKADDHRLSERAARLVPEARRQGERVVGVRREPGARRECGAPARHAEEPVGRGSRDSAARSPAASTGRLNVTMTWVSSGRHPRRPAASPPPPRAASARPRRATPAMAPARARATTVPRMSKRSAGVTARAQ